MVKSGGLPGRGSVTVGAKLTHAALVRVIISMTRIAIAGRAFENTVDVAARTGSAGVRTG